MWDKTTESELWPRNRPFRDWVRLECIAVACAYFLVPEGLHQTDCLLHRQGEGEVRSWVNLWHLDVLVAEVPFPLCVPANLVLSEDVWDQISWCIGQEFKLRDSVLKKKHPFRQSKCKSYAHCLMVWNCPWGSRGNYKAAQEGRHETGGVIFTIPLQKAEVRSHLVVSHLYLSLFSRVFDGLEDVPSIPASHLCAGYILTVPSLNQDSCSYSWNTREQKAGGQKSP